MLYIDIELNTNVCIWSCVSLAEVRHQPMITIQHLVPLLQVSASLLGEPDLGLLTPPEMARKAGQISGSIPNIPVIVDADTGGCRRCQF